MNLNEINFSFGGLHCLRDFGCIYAEKSGHPITPGITRNEYEIAGVPGTVLLPGELPDVLTFDGTLYFMDEPPSQAAAQERLRRMAAWLTAGRQPLIFDYEPTRYYLASVNKGLEWNYSGWIGGGLDVSFEAQPYARSVRETTASAATTGESASLAFTLDTGLPAPLCLRIENTGAAPITGATVAVNGKSIVFVDMSLTAGDALDVSMEPPIGAVFALNGASALPHAERFDALKAVRGTQTVTVTLAYGGGAKGARITARARGRWL